MTETIEANTDGADHQPLAGWRPGFVYFTYAPELRRCKIGWTERSPVARLGSHTDSPERLNQWGFLLAESKAMEVHLHNRFDYLRLKGEWFAVDDYMHRFVQSHTYKDESQLHTDGWQQSDWDFWDTHIAPDRNAQTLIRWCQCDPLGLVEKYADPSMFFYIEIKPWLLAWFGRENYWRDEGHPLRTSQAYDLIYEMCVDLLPC